MADTTTRAAARTAGPSKPAVKHDNVFTRKIGPLPMWASLAIVAAGIGVWAIIANKKASSSSSSDEANASEVPDFINQTYVSGYPPSAPGTTGAVPGPPEVQPGGPGQATSPSSNPNHITAGQAAQVATALPGSSAAGNVNLAATGIGNKYNTAASKARATARKDARIAARKGTAASTTSSTGKTTSTKATRTAARKAARVAARKAK